MKKNNVLTLKIKNRKDIDFQNAKLKIEEVQNYVNLALKSLDDLHKILIEKLPVEYLNRVNKSISDILSK